jgi:hypothetical protein
VAGSAIKTGVSRDYPADAQIRILIVWMRGVQVDLAVVWIEVQIRNLAISCAGARHKLSLSVLVTRDLSSL